MAAAAADGYDHLTRHTFYGLRFHARRCWPDVITQFELAPGNVQEVEVAGDLAEGTHVVLLGDRNYLVAAHTRGPGARWGRAVRALSRCKARSATAAEPPAQPVSLSH